MILLRHHHQSATGQRPSKLHPQNHIKETAGMQYAQTKVRADVEVFSQLLLHYVRPFLTVVQHMKHIYVECFVLCNVLCVFARLYRHTFSSALNLHFWLSRHYIWWWHVMSCTSKGTIRENVASVGESQSRGQWYFEIISELCIKELSKIQIVISSYILSN